MKALDLYGDAIKEADAFVRELDETIRLAAFNLLMEEERSIQPIAGEVMKPSATQQTNRAMSPQELIYLCKATTLMNKAVVLGYWLEEFQGNTSFTSADLKNAFLSAREP